MGNHRHPLAASAAAVAVLTAVLGAWAYVVVMKVDRLPGPTAATPAASTTALPG